MNRKRSLTWGWLVGPLLALSLFLGGTALAADGRLIAAAGEVTVERPERGGPRSVAAEVGFELQAGDTIRTGPDGRAQLRLNDGAIFSLQPRTVFRIDEYRFDAERQRGFFSLLRGALRTASGQIGKRDRDDYRLRTPTATVGIRGTQYMAEETVCDPGCWPGSRPGLHVSVTEGRIAVTNDFGTLEIGAGEAARVEPAAPPRRAALPPRLPPREMLAADEKDSDQAGTDASPTLVAQASPAEGGASGDIQDGAPLAIGPVDGPARAGGPTAGGADWDGVRLARLEPAATGGQPPIGGDPASDPLSIGPGPGFDLDFAPNAERDASGRLLTLNDEVLPAPNPPVGGDPGPGDPGPGDPGPGDPGPGDPGPGDPGPGDPGPGDPGPGDPGPGDPGPGDPGPGDPGPGDPGPGDPGPGDPGPGDPGPGDPGPGDPGPGDPGEGDPGPGDPGPGDPGEGEIPSDGDTSTALWRVDVRPTNGLTNLAQVLGAGGRLHFDAERRLTGLGICPYAACLSSGTTRIAEAGSDPWVSWGRWTEGSAVMRFLGLGFAIPFGPNTGLHYLVGSPALTVPTSGQFAYALSGATAPTMSGGQWAPGSFSGTAAVRFDPGQAARLGLDATVTFDQASFRIATEGGAGNPGASSVRFDSNHAFDAAIAATQTSGNFCRGSSCEARISGGLFGPNGERLGVGYTIDGPNRSTTIDGVGVFTRQ